MVLTLTLTLTLTQLYLIERVHGFNVDGLPEIDQYQLHNVGDEDNTDLEIRIIREPYRHLPNKEIINIGDNS